jgi:hypothetical protein
MLMGWVYNPADQRCRSWSDSESGFHQSEVWISSRIRLRIWILLSPSKKVRKTLIPTALWLLFWLFIFENDVQVLSKSNTQKNCLKNLFFVGILGRSMTKKAGSGSASGSGSISQRHGSADPDPDPDPPQNVMDPQHCSSRRLTSLWIR